MARHRQIRLDRDPAGPVRGHAQRAAEGGARNTRRPHHRARADLLAADPHRVGRDARDLRARADLDAEPGQAARRRAGEIGGEAREETGPALEEDHARVRRIDGAEVPGDGVAGDLREGAGQLHSGGPAAHDHEGEQGGALGAVLRALRRLEREEEPAPDLQRILQRLEPGRQGFPFVVAEVRVACAGGHDERVVGEHVARVEGHAPRRRVHRLRLGEEHAHARGVAQDGAERHRDVRRRQDGARHLIEERLEEVMVAPVHQCDAHVAAGEPARGVEAGEPAAHDHDVRRARIRHASHLRVYYRP